MRSFKRVEGNNKDDERRAMFFSYRGTDATTRTLLNVFADRWSNEPLEFWYRPGSSGGPSIRCSDVLADLVREYMNTRACAGIGDTRLSEIGKPRNGQQAPSWNDIAGRLQNEVDFNEPVRNIVKVLETMDDHGSRYLNLEGHLGSGTCMLLGVSLSESHWTKLLGKSGSFFDRVVSIIQTETNIPHQLLRQGRAEPQSAGSACPLPRHDYAAIRNAIVRAKVAQIFYQFRC